MTTHNTNRFSNSRLKSICSLAIIAMFSTACASKARVARLSNSHVSNTRSGDANTQTATVDVVTKYDGREFGLTADPLVPSAGIIKIYSSAFPQETPQPVALVFDKKTGVAPAIFNDVHPGTTYVAVLTSITLMAGTTSYNLTPATMDAAAWSKSNKIIFSGDLKASAFVVSQIAAVAQGNAGKLAVTLAQIDARSQVSGSRTAGGTGGSTGGTSGGGGSTAGGSSTGGGMPAASGGSVGVTVGPAPAISIESAVADASGVVTINGTCSDASYAVISTDPLDLLCGQGYLYGDSRSQYAGDLFFSAMNGAYDFAVDSDRYGGCMVNQVQDLDLAKTDASPSMIMHGANCDQKGLTYTVSAGAFASGKATFTLKVSGLPLDASLLSIVFGTTQGGMVSFPVSF